MIGGLKQIEAEIQHVAGLIAVQKNKTALAAHAPAAKSWTISYRGSANFSMRCDTARFVAVGYRMAAAQLAPRVSRAQQTAAVPRRSFGRNRQALEEQSNRGKCRGAN